MNIFTYLGWCVAGLLLIAVTYLATAPLAVAVGSGSREELHALRMDLSELLQINKLYADRLNEVDQWPDAETFGDRYTAVTGKQLRAAKYGHQFAN